MGHRKKSYATFREFALGTHPFCQWCGIRLGSDSATTDHIIPLSKGGTNEWKNLCLACVGCNTDKGNSIVEEQPSGPTWVRPKWKKIKIAMRKGHRSSSG